MAARLNKRHQESTRMKIQAGVIIDRLEKHVKGEIELSSSQVRSAEILLNKTIPNLTSTELQATVENVPANELTEAELLRIAAASSTGAAEKARSEEESTKLH